MARSQNGRCFCRRRWVRFQLFLESKTQSCRFCFYFIYPFQRQNNMSCLDLSMHWLPGQARAYASQFVPEKIRITINISLTLSLSLTQRVSGFACLCLCCLPTYLSMSVFRSLCLSYSTSASFPLLHIFVSAVFLSPSLSLFAFAVTLYLFLSL